MASASGGPRRSGDGAYGEHLADCFGLREPGLHIERKLQRGTVAVSELRVDVPSAELSDPLGYDEAFLVGIQLRNIVGHEYWLDGRWIAVDPAMAGMTYIHDLRCDPRALVREPTHALHFYLPLATLNAFADQNETAAISELMHRPMVGRDDQVMRSLSQAALAALREHHLASDLLVDEILSAICAHVLGSYGNARAPCAPWMAGLARWQELRAKEMMNERMDVSLAELAQECRLSITHFVRGFRRSTGMAPHQWLLARRISKARILLAESTCSLAEIALLCGFSSQSHFSVAFKSSTNVSPGRWRRSFSTRNNGCPK